MTVASGPANYDRVPISFFDVDDSAGYEPIGLTQTSPNQWWDGGGFLATAPVDVAKTFDGAWFASTNVEAAFGMRGRRIRAGFTVPTRHHNLRQLMVVTSGELNITHDGDQKLQLTIGGFWIAEAGTAYSLTAGPEGVTYIESYPQALSTVETVWHDDPNWVRR